MGFPKLPCATQEIIKRDQICQWVYQLADPSSRDSALIELNKRKDVIPDLGTLLWHSFGTIAALIQEMVKVYPLLNPLTLEPSQSVRVCNVLNLLKSVANHPETKTKFAQAMIPDYIFPFLKLYRGKPYENVRVAGLRVLEALVKNNSEEAVRYILSTEFIVYIIEILEKDSPNLSWIAFSIFQNIISHEDGLVRVCETYERFSCVSTALGNVVKKLSHGAARGGDSSKHAVVTLTLVLHCYLRLCQNGRAREALRRSLPPQLNDGTFSQYMNEDLTLKTALAQLLNNLGLCAFVFEMQSLD